MVFDALQNELAAVADLSLLTSPAELDRYSRDAYDYSPVLREQLSQCRADLVVSAASVQAVQAVAAACHRHGVPLTLRGSGTGNYGQSVPLKGGVVLLMDALREVRSIDPASGVVTVECGCLMRDLDRALAVHRRQLRLFPSTWRSATIGGFISGGSGGIGSVRWGFLRDPGHLLGSGGGDDGGFTSAVATGGNGGGSLESRLRHQWHHHGAHALLGGAGGVAGGGCGLFRLDNGGGVGPALWSSCG